MNDEPDSVSCCPEHGSPLVFDCSEREEMCPVCGWPWDN